MSGTSLDGVDAALVDFGNPTPLTLATHFAPFDVELRAEFMALQTPGPNELERAALAANRLAIAYAAGVAAVLERTGLSPGAIRAIGAHGQTVRHRPESGFTIQINNPAKLAELTGIDVVADFRARDVAAGGQGAPLAPAFHQAYFGAAGRARVVLNVGGIANATLLDAAGGVRGFDTGPGNVLLDHWCLHQRGTPFDDAGTWARGGTVLPDLLEAMLAEPYFALPAPKSTGRDLFNEHWLARHMVASGGQDARPVDIQATLTELTAASASAALRGMAPEAVHVCGGGARNAFLMERLASRLAPARVADTAELGVPADWVEAVAFAWLAWQHVAGHHANLPDVTGARGLRRLGALHPH